MRLKMAKHMHDTFAAIFKEMGGELTGVRNDKHDQRHLDRWRDYS